MKNIKIQTFTRIVLTNGSVISIPSTSNKRLFLLKNDLFTLSFWNPFLSFSYDNWKEKWSQFDWGQD